MADTSRELVTCTVTDGIAHVRLDRPDKLNALTLETLDQLVATARSLRGDRTLRAVVLAGEGTSFCAGLDFGTVHEAARGHRPGVRAAAVARHEHVPGGLLGLAPAAGAGDRRGARALLRRRRPDRAGRGLPLRHPRLRVVGAGGALGD